MVEPVPVPVPVDMVVVCMGGAMGAVGGTVGAVFACPEAGGSVKEVWWRVLVVGRVTVFWEGLGGSVSMAAVD